MRSSILSGETILSVAVVRLFVVVLGANSTIVDSGKPGIEGIGLPRLFEFISSVGVRIIHDKVQSVKLGTFDAEAHVPVIGTIQFVFDDVTLDAIDTSSTTAAVVPNDDGTLILTVNGIAARIGCQFHYRRKPWPHVRGHGTADVEVRDGHAILKGRVSNDGAGNPQITLVDEAEVDFPTLNVHVHDTKMAFLYNLIVKLAHSHIKHTAIDAVTREVSEKVPEEGNKLLRGLPSIVSIQGFDLNVSMVGEPTVTASSFVQRHWGRFQLPSGAFEQCPFTSDLLPVYTTQQHHPDSPASPPTRVTQVLIGQPKALHDSRTSNAGNIFSHVHNILQDLLLKGSRKAKFPFRASTTKPQAPQVDSRPCCPQHYKPAATETATALFNKHSGRSVTSKAWMSPWQHMHGPLTDGSTPMLEMYISQSVPSCFTWVLWKQGKLNITLSPDTVPLGALSSSTWALAFPSLVRKYPGRNLTLQAYATAPPSSIIAEDGGFTIEAEADMQFYLQCEARDGEGCPLLFSIHVAGNVTVDTLRFEPVPPDMHQYVLLVKLMVEPFGLQVGVVQSEVGPPVDIHLQVGIRVILAMVQQQVNDEMLKNGFVLPKIPFINFVDLNMTYAQNALLLSSNFEYAP